MKRLSLIFLVLLTQAQVKGMQEEKKIEEEKYASIDDLAAWFADGMTEYEKDQKSEVVEFPANNNYTQTEAYMKLSWDSINKAKEKYLAPFGYHAFVINYFLQKKFTTPQDIRNNEDEIILKILNLYKESTGYPKNSVELLPLIKNILEKERLYSNYYVFYHAYDANLGLIFDIYREIQNFLMYAANIFSLEKNDYIADKETVLRDIQSIEFPFKDIDEFINYYDSVFPKNSWFDHSEPLRSQILSTNVALFGNLCCPGESSFLYFLTSHSHLDLSLEILHQIFSGWNVNVFKYKEELINLYKNFMTSETGHLTQIFIPADKVDSYAYISQPGGTPIRYKITDTFDSDLQRHKDIKSILDFYKKADSSKFKDMSFDSLQARIVLMPSFFDPYNGIKIFRYTTAGLEKEFGADYKKGLRRIVAKMIIEYIEENQKTIQEGSNEVLKRILNEILQWIEITKTGFADSSKDRIMESKEIIWNVVPGPIGKIGPTGKI